MKGRFKFRVWSIKNNFFVTRGCELHYILSLIYQGEIVEGDIYQQYTGINDSNDTPIYEGDILKDSWVENRPYSYSPDEEYSCDKVFEVKYEHYSFNLEEKYNREQTCIERFHREVIGNIFENPELLK